MSSAKEIRTKIKSIESTQKITKAMEMVAASKMRKAQDRMTMSRPYADRIQEVIRHIGSGSLEYEHPYTIKRDVKRVGYIVISSDRGLCGGLNINLFKKSFESMEEFYNKKIEIDVATVGTKATSFFLRQNASVIASAKHLGDAPVVKDLIGVIKVMLEKYDNEEIDELHLIYNKFVNTMTQDPTVKKLLPIENDPALQADKGTNWDYIYEPSAEPLLNNLMSRYVESLIYQATVENVACEQAARMVAMKSATDNAGDLIKEFKLLYNKARQASITQELSEIVAGAAAV